MATKQRMTKEDRETREDALVDAMFYALTTMTKEHAVAWSRRVGRLSEGLSAAAIKRADKRAQKMAADMPPGHVKAMEAMDLHDELCRKRGIPKREADAAWGAVAQLCMFQLASKRGPFYEAAVEFRLVQAAQGPVSIDHESSTRDAMRACGCPNCRPRTAEELN